MQSLPLGVEVISYNPPSEDIKKFLFNCRLCGKVAGNIFDVDQHNIDKGHFKCMFKDCNVVKFPSQFELFAHHEAKHKTLQRPVPVNSESLAPNLLPQQLVLATQSPQRSSAALPQNQSFTVLRSGYSNESKHVEGGAGSRTDQTNSTGKEVVVLDDSEEMDYNVATPAEQVSSRLSAVERPPRPPTVDLTGDEPAPVSYPLPNRVCGQGRVAANSSRFTRQVCDKTFSSQETLNQHMNIAHRSQNNRCPESRAVCIPVADLNKPGTLEQLRQFLNQRHHPVGRPQRRLQQELLRSPLHSSR